MTITATDIRNKQVELLQAGAMFEMHDVTLQGHTYKCFKNAFTTLTEALQTGREHGDQDFLVYENRRYNFSEFYYAVDAMAASFQHDYRVANGDRIAIAMRNNPEWVITFVAAVLVGAIVVPINSWGKTEELEYAIADCGAKVLVCDEPRLQLVFGCYEKLDCSVIVTGPDNPLSDGKDIRRFDQLLQQGQGRDYQVADPETEDPCMILYTSGSTGFPKGVVIRHISLAQALMHFMFFGMLVMELDGPAQLRGGAERDATLATVPLFHATGLIGGLIMPLLTGQKVVLMYKWDAINALRFIQEERITAFATVPTVLQDLLNHPEFDNYETTSLLRLSAGGAAAPAGLPELIEQKVDQPIRSLGWGMTETVGVGSIMIGGLCSLAPNSAGLFSPLIEARFVDSNNHVVQPGEIGEIEVRSVCCTAGYWNKPEATASIFSNDHWMKTGDLGRLDDNGYLHITGRIKEIVIRGGENIYPGEIEAICYAIEGVHEAVVFGVPDDVMGEELAMTVYLATECQLDEYTIRNRLSKRLAAYKIPKYINISPTPLPQNASGKLHKLKVREAFLGKY